MAALKGTFTIPAKQLATNNCWVVKSASDLTPCTLFMNSYDPKNKALTGVTASNGEAQPLKKPLIPLCLNTVLHSYSIVVPFI